MYSTAVMPQTDETDSFGHISSAALAHWFDSARNPLVRIFVHDLNIKRETFPLIMAHTDYDFENELSYKQEVEIYTWIIHIGSKSFTVYHEAWQGGRLCVKGSAVLVHYDTKTRQSISIPAEKKKLLEIHMHPEYLNMSPDLPPEKPLTKAQKRK